MPVDVSGILEKIKRADEHIVYLIGENTRFRDSCDCSIAQEFDPDTSIHTWRVKGDAAPIEQRVAVIVGETIHHLRSILDHIVYQLAIRHADDTGSTVTKSTQRGFPIFIDEPVSESHKDRFRGKVQGLSSSAIAQIESLQPYKYGLADKTKDYPLRILDDLDVADKHRLINVVSGGVVVVNMAIKPKDFREPLIFNSLDTRNFKRRVELKAGAEIGHVTGNANMHVDAQLSPQITLAKVGSGEYEPVVPCLQQLRNFIGRLTMIFANNFLLEPVTPGQETPPAV